MITLWKKLKSSEFLSYAELLKLKVSVVLFVLFIIGVLTVPVTFIEDFSLQIKIITPSIFVVLFIASIAMLSFNKVRFAMHFSIYIFIGLTVYYFVGSNQFYGYLVIFITLTIIIFYHDINTYILYGGALTIYGVFYIQNNAAVLVSDSMSQYGLSSLIYQMILVGFYLIYLVHFILSESIDARLDKAYLKLQKNAEKYRGQCLKYVEDITYKNDDTPLYENKFIQESVKALSLFLNEFFEEDNEGIKENVEFYFFLHKQNIASIMENKEVRKTVKEKTLVYERYLMNSNSELNEILFAFVAQFKPGFEPYDKQRYLSHLESLFKGRTNKLIALAILYQYLRKEPTQYDQWGRVEKVFEHDEVVELFSSPVFREIISYEDMQFFLTNQAIFKEHLG